MKLEWLIGLLHTQAPSGGPGSIGGAGAED